MQLDEIKRRQQQSQQQQRQQGQPSRLQAPPQQRQQGQPPPPPSIDVDAEYFNEATKVVSRLKELIYQYIDTEEDDDETIDDILETCYDKFITALHNGDTKAQAKSKTTSYANERLFDEFGVRLAPEVIGSGLKKRRGRPKGSGIKKTFDDYKDPDLGVKSKTPFISFGKHFINNNKLQDGIISLRHKSGAGLPNFPSRKVSPNLSSIIKTIVGGGMPSYNDVDKLSDEEKNYLHQISKKSDLTQMLAIPAPSKDKMEKDFNQFEIMKGEIMAGNDSKDLIKKFKVLLLKLVNTGQLPKQQVQEIMTELLEMGY
jgi:hypothetical protein